MDTRHLDVKLNNRLKDSHLNDRCFIVATGPSINQQDLTRLKGEFVIGVSGLYKHKDIQTIAPKYYVLPPIFRSHGKLFKEESFIDWLTEMDKVLSHETVFFFDISDQKYIEKYQLFKNKKIIWTRYSAKPTLTGKEAEIKEIDLLSMPPIWSVSESAIQIALNLGFKEIYLLGIDHSWQQDILAHFTDSYNSHFDKKELDACKVWIDSEHEMERHSHIFKKYKKLFLLKRNIYNANANQDSYVDTFPKVRYESLF